MKFFDRLTSAQVAKKQGLIPNDWTSRQLATAAVSGRLYMKPSASIATPKFMFMQLKDEADWVDKGMPYYSVWPAILDCLRKTRLDIPGDSIHLPRKPILLRFSEDKPFIVEGVTVRSLLVNETVVEVSKDSRDAAGWAIPGSKNDNGLPIYDADGNTLRPQEKSLRGMVIWADFGETEVVDGFTVPVGTWRVFQLDGMTVEEALAASARTTDPISNAESVAMLECIKIALAVAMLNENTEFFVADVLSKDASA